MWLWMGYLTFSNNAPIKHNILRVNLDAGDFRGFSMSTTDSETAIEKILNF